jgi:hypothetical protein
VHVVHANIMLLIACMIHIIYILLLKLDRIFPEISGIKAICKVNEWLSKVGTCMHEDRDF